MSDTNDREDKGDGDRPERRTWAQRNGAMLVIVIMGLLLALLILAEMKS